MKGYIYKYTFPNGKVYIGQTRTSIELRHKQHITEYSGKGNPRLWEAFNKYKDYKLDVMQTIECADQNELMYQLNQLEALYINLYNSCSPNYGYNVLPNAIFTPDYQKIIRDKFHELFEQRNNELHKRKEDIENKLSNKKGKLTESEKKFFEWGCCDSDYPFYFSLDSINYDDLSKNTFDIYDFYTEEVLDVWSFKIEEEARTWAEQYINEHANIIIYEARRNKMIVAIEKDDKENNVALIFNNTNEIAQHFNVARPVNVRNVLEGRQKTAYGYRWMYLTEYEKNFKTIADI